MYICFFPAATEQPSQAVMTGIVFVELVLAPGHTLGVACISLELSFLHRLVKLLARWLELSSDAYRPRCPEPCTTPTLSWTSFWGKIGSYLYHLPKPTRRLFNSIWAKRTSLKLPTELLGAKQ